MRGGELVLELVLRVRHRSNNRHAKESGILSLKFRVFSGLIIEGFFGFISEVFLA